MLNISELNKKAKIRIITFTILHILICISAILYTIEFKDTFKSMGYASNVNIDGSDLTDIVNIGIGATKGILGITFMAAYTITMLIICGILLIPFRLIAIKNSVLDDNEVRIVRWMIAVTSVIAFMIGLIITGIGFVIHIVELLGISLVIELMVYRKPKIQEDI